MSDEGRPLHDSPDPELEEALGRLEQPAARGEFRDALREQFVSGRFESAASDELHPVPAAEETTAVPRPATVGRRRIWGAVALVAASVALLLFLWEADAPRIDHGPWKLVSAGGVVRVDGVDFVAADREGLNAALEAGKHIEVLAGDLRLRLADALLLEATADTDFRLDEVHAEADLALAARSGHVRVVTGPAFPGTELALRTPDIELGVTGTAFAIDIYDKGTCVCCTHGNVDVEPLDIPCAHVVKAGQMVFANRSRATPCPTGPAMEDHAAPLRLLEELAATLWP